MPVVPLSDASLGDLQLLLSGVELPWPVLGARLDAQPGSAHLDAVHLKLRPDEADLALTSGGAVLVDREQTPLARLVEPVTNGMSDDGSLLVRGRLRPLRAREAQLYAERVRRPDQLAGPAGERVVVVVTRPPLAGELSQVRGQADAELLVLVPTESATPDAMPPVILMRCVEAAVRAEGTPAVCLPVPLVWRDRASDEALAQAVGRAYQGHRTVLLGEDSQWTDVVDALHEGRPMPNTVMRPLADELVRWRPPRHRRGLVVLLTGLSGSGKSTVARDLAQHIESATLRTVSLLDGDDVRRLLSSGLGFDRAARDLNVRRIGFVASEVARHGGVAVCAPIAPYAESRAAVRRMVEPVGDFVLVHVATPLEECERRDLKGLYARARAGEVPEFTGVSDPYDVPDDADVTVDTSTADRAEALAAVVEFLQRGRWLPSAATAEGAAP